MRRLVFTIGVTALLAGVTSVVFAAPLITQVPACTELVSPNPGEVLDNGCIDFSNPMHWEFDWTDCPGATAYHLYVQNVGALAVIDDNTLVTSGYVFERMSYIGNGNRFDWRWKVQSFVNGQWTEWTAERSFDVEPLDTDCKPPPPPPACTELVSPNSGETLDNGCIDGSDPIHWEFDWTDCPGATAYHLYVQHVDALFAVIDDNTLVTSDYVFESKGYIGNRFDWRWKVQSFVNGQWSEWTAERSFDVEPFDIDCGPPPPPPGPEPSSPRLMIHVRAPASKNPCANGALLDCRDAVTSGELSTPKGPFYFAYLLAAKGSQVEGLAGIQCGVTYETGHPEDQLNGLGIDVFGWTLCASLEFAGQAPTPWPCPGSGNLITWSSAAQCQTGPTAVAGFFYLGAYSADRLQITVRPVDQSAKIANCESMETNLGNDQLGYASFSAGATDPGCNPCLADGCAVPIPVKATTWSGIKTLQVH